MKPEIGFVTDHCCVRVVKEATVLRQLGYNVHLFSRTLSSVSSFSSVHYYSSPYQLEQALSLTKSSIGIWQYHNEPNWPVLLMRRVLGDSAKIIMDYHDSNYWRMDVSETKPQLLENASWYSENSAVELADAFVVPSTPCFEELRTRTNKPIAVLPPASPQTFYRYMEVPFMGGLVSQGGHAITALGIGTDGDHWRDFRSLYNDLNGKKRVYAYCPSFTLDPSNPLDAAYAATGALLGKLTHDQLLDRLPSHTWNLVGNPNKSYVWNFALPNKFFDAAAAGTPSVVFNCTEAAKIVTDLNIGIVVNSADELIARWGEHVEKRANLWRVRHELCMEKYISSLTDLYEGLL